MKRILILDTETTGTGDDAVCIEVAACLYSVEHACALSSFSTLLPSSSNHAEAINRIPAAALAEPMRHPLDIWQDVRDLARDAEAILAHGAAFDQRFADFPSGWEVPWICSMEDLDWPRPQGPRCSLVKLALAHDLGVSHAHRAAVDVDLLSRLLTRVAGMGHDIEAMLIRGLRPKALYQAITTYAEREAPKAAGFSWDPQAKAWSRRMAREDVEYLPFKVREVGA